MLKQSDLIEKLHQVHKKSYPAYKSLRGQYDWGRYVLSIDHVQGDPFASPSGISIHVPLKEAGFLPLYYKEEISRIALEDTLLRRFSEELEKISFKAKGSGKSGLVSTTRCGQEILSRTGMRITEKDLIARCEVGFPARGRTIDAIELEKILIRLLPEAVKKSLYAASWRPEVLRHVYELSQDQQYIRKELEQRNLAAFVADGSVLPRESGVSQKPLKGAVAFASPQSCRVEMDLPFHGRLSGMGIPRGITLIAGGGYHGKSTLLQALERGVYDHIRGDGREYVITDETAVKLRAEDGRSVRNLDLSLFIHDLPNGKDTHCFSTEDASGSTSQAAGVMEGIEAGSRVFLIDEDTSATNFLVRDEFMQKIVHPDKEPITPFLARARDLYEKAGISTIIVAGSSGAFFHIADMVIQMDSYRPVDVTDKVKSLLDQYPIPKLEVPEFALPKEPRRIEWKSIRGKGRDGRIKVKIHGSDGFSIGMENVDLRYVEQLVDTEQTAALAGMLKMLVQTGGKHTIAEMAEAVWQQMRKKGLESFQDGTAHLGYARPRKQEICLMLDRYRG